MNEYIGHICQMCKHKDYCYLGHGREIKTCVLLENQERVMDDICVGGGKLTVNDILEHLGTLVYDDIS